MTSNSSSNTNFPWLSPTDNPTRTLNCQLQSHVTTDDQSASLSWNKAPIWGLRPDFHYCQTIAGSEFASHITTLHGPNAQKTRFRYCCMRVPRNRYLASPLARWLLPSNGPHRKHCSYCCVLKYVNLAVA
jgi:hypothetical protein